jgi:hypothetical protein
MKSNAPGSIFLIAVLYLPTEAERIDGGKKKVLVEPQFVLADDIAAATNKAIMLAAKSTVVADADPDRYEVLAVNPF